MPKLELVDLPFDQYQRYRVVQQIVGMVRNHLCCSRLRVLDVGGFFRTITGEDILPIAQFLPEDHTVAVDLAECTVSSYVRGNGAHLPFVDGSFDVVTTCDTLEHVPRSHRPAFVDELLRVAARYVILAAPFDDNLTRLADQVIFDFDQTFYNFEQPQLREHIENVLPNRGELCDWIEQRGHLYVDFASGYLHHWLPMMLLKHYLFGVPDSAHLHVNLDRYYNLNFTHRGQRAPAYRHVFVISKTKEDETFLAQVARSFQSLSNVSSDDGVALARSLLTLVEWQREFRRERERNRFMVLQEQNEQLQEQNEQLRERCRQLAQHIEAIRNGRVMRLMTGVRQLWLGITGAKERL